LLVKTDRSTPLGESAFTAIARRPELRLAILNLLHDKVRFAVTVIGIAFSVFLMAFQACLLGGFERAAGAIINATDGEIWITARGVRSFDMGSSPNASAIWLIRPVT
jgi:putative ABC transport system permease protein